MSITVKTQNELDVALAKPGYVEIIIDSPRLGDDVAAAGDELRDRI